MRATTVRFSDDLWALLEAEASQQGISAAQFVRDATIMRLGMLSGRRGDVDAALTLEQLAAGALDGRPRAGATPTASPSCAARGCWTRRPRRPTTASPNSPRACSTSLSP